MKTRHTLFLLGAFGSLVALAHGSVTADITVWDQIDDDPNFNDPIGWEFTGGIAIDDPRDPAPDGSEPFAEAGEVEYPSTQAPQWDLRAFGFTSTNDLVYQGGFNPLTGQDGLGFGTIFIDTAQPAFQDPANHAGANIASYGTGNSLGFDYAIVFETVNGDPNGTAITLNCTIYDLWDDANNQAYGDVVLNGVTESVNTEGAPYRRIAGGVALGITTATYEYTTSGLMPGMISDQKKPMYDYGQANHWLSINLDLIPEDLVEAEATFHVTQACGNDKLVGQVTSAIPEPATGAVALLGLFMAGVFSTSRRSVMRACKPAIR